MPNIITIPGNFTHGDELLLVRWKEYKKLTKELAEIKHAFKVIRDGEKEFKQGKIKPIHSVAELLHKK